MERRRAVEGTSAAPAALNQITAVRAYPRIHMSLVDLGHATARSYGGIGFSIDGLPIEVEVTEARKTKINSLVPLDSQALQECREVVERARTAWQFGDVTVTVRAMPPQHVGLGTKTALLLATLKSISVHFEIPSRSSDLQYLSGRGGASGIGIHAFFHGGVIADGGHRQTGGPLTPSSARRSPEIPPLVARHEFPKEWVVQLLLPSGERICGGREKEFFITNTPIEKQDVFSTLGFVYHTLIPSIVQADFAAFREGAIGLQSVGFKQREVVNQAAGVQTLIADLLAHESVAPGMSSLGPLVYVVTKREDNEAREATHAICSRHSVASLGVFEGRNQGFEVIGK